MYMYLGSDAIRLREALVWPSAAHRLVNLTSGLSLRQLSHANIIPLILCWLAAVGADVGDTVYGVGAHHGSTSRLPLTHRISN